VNDPDSANAASRRPARRLLSRRVVIKIPPGRAPDPSKPRRLRTDLVLVAVLTVVAAAVVLLVPTGWAVLRAPAAVGLVLALPGYAFAAAVFSPHQLRPAERLLLSVALSIAATILSALLLQVAAVRLTVRPWAGLLSGLGLVALAIAQLRGHAQRLRQQRLAPRVAEVLALAMSLLLLAGAAALGFSPLPAPKGTQGSTALSIAPVGLASFRIGASSDQLATRRYIVQVDVTGAPAVRFGPITLAPGQSWSRLVSTAPGEPSVRADLYTVADPTVSIDFVTLAAGWFGAGLGSPAPTP
jgi:uncharacterized membrane protein HdeD (DUF308 family)